MGRDGERERDRAVVGVIRTRAGGLYSRGIDMSCLMVGSTCGSGGRVVVRAYRAGFRGSASSCAHGA